MTLCVGYLVASTGPWVLGPAHDLTDAWTLPLVILLVATPCRSGWRASRDRTVDAWRRR